MSAIKAIAMREPEEFPLDLLNLNLEDYHMHYDALPELSLDIHEDGFGQNWLLPLDNTISCMPLSPTTTSVVKSEAALISPSADETYVDIKQFSSPPATPSGSSSKCASGYTSPIPIKTPGFTPSPSPFSSYPSSPNYGRQSPGPSGTKPKEKQKLPRHKRKSHIDAELRRRSKIQTAFDELKAAVPTLNEKDAKNGRQSKSAMLAKTVEFCRELRNDKKELQHEANILRQEIQALSADLTICQQRLPAHGLASPDGKSNNKDHVRQMFEDYVQAKSLANWKFWIFSLFIRPLFETYNDTVMTDSAESFCGSVVSWVQDNLSLVKLRPALLDTLRYMSRKTTVMTTPEKLPEEATLAAITSTLKKDEMNQPMEIS